MSASEIPVLYEITVRGRRKQSKSWLKEREIQQISASCQVIILVLQLFASATFQGHPSEKLDWEKSF